MWFAQGDRVTIVANLLMVHRSLQAAKMLEQEGIQVEVIDPRTLVPLDEQTIFKSVQKTGRLVIVEEDNLTGGWGAEVAARVADACLGYLEAPIRRVAAPDTPVPFAPVMENRYVPSVERILRRYAAYCERGYGRRLPGDSGRRRFCPAGCGPPSTRRTQDHRWISAQRGRLRRECSG